MSIRSRLWKRPEQGSVAVEMAIILPIFLVLLAVPLFLAIVFWCYSAGQKAAHDGARYLSTATQAEMRTPGGGFNEATVAATARWIAQQELEGILPFVDGIPIVIECNASTACGGSVPATVHVRVQINLHDTFFDSITMDSIGGTGMLMVSDVTLRYVGG
jgi:cbb3-type cytochrome oxidase subunit 3